MRVTLQTLVLASAFLVAPVTETAAIKAHSVEPAFAELLARARKDIATKEGPAYDIVIGKQVGRRHAHDVGMCVNASPVAPEPFKIVLVVEESGKVTTVALSAETAVATCIRKALVTEKFPKPPFAPFHDLIEMAFE